MTKNWSKIVLVSVLVLMVTASLSFATTARVRSLANTGDYITDDSNAQRWYSVLPMYGNQVNAEVGTWTGSLSDTRGLAWTTVCGEDGKWGTYRIALNENAIDHPGFFSASPFYMMHLPSWGLSGLMSFYDGFGATPFNFGATPINKFDLAGGWEIGESGAVGVSITHSGWKRDYSDTLLTQDDKASMLTFGVGGTWTNNEDITFDGTFTIAKSSVEAAWAQETGGFDETLDVEDDNSMAFDIAARLFWDWTDNTQVVPVLEFSKSEYDLTLSSTFDGDDTGGAHILGKDTYFKLGVGLNVDVNSGNTLIFAAEFANYEYEQMAETLPPDDPAETDLDIIVSNTYMPKLRLALESEVTPWMTTRVGAAKAIGKTKFEDNEASSEEEVSAGSKAIFDDFLAEYDNMFDWFLGVGFNVAEWTIDMELAHETPFSLGYWLTGYSAWDNDFGSPFAPPYEGVSDAVGPIYRISAVYNY